MLAVVLGRCRAVDVEDDDDDDASYVELSDVDGWDIRRVVGDENGIELGLAVVVAYRIVVVMTEESEKAIYCSSKVIVTTLPHMSDVIGK